MLAINSKLNKRLPWCLGCGKDPAECACSAKSDPKISRLRIQKAQEKRDRRAAKDYPRPDAEGAL